LVFLDILLAILDFSSAAVVNDLHAHILLTSTKLGSINSDEESADATLLSMLHILLGNLPIAVDITKESQYDR
jgi:hypothetical protein